MKSDVFEAGGTVAQTFGSSTDAQVAAARLRGAGFSDVRLSEADGRTTEDHIDAASGATELDFEALLERAGFGAERAREVTRAVAGGAVLLTVAAGHRAPDAAAVLRGESVAALPLLAVDIAPAEPVAPGASAPLSTSEPGDRVVPLRAERLGVARENVTHEARIRKEVVTEQRTVTVPVAREQLVIERDGEAPVRIPLTER